jgi:hypothetical protein
MRRTELNATLAPAGLNGDFLTLGFLSAIP